jgi:isopentenyl-diphosphate delta-isomerase type 1
LIRANGSAGKTAIHRAGLLHRAFSIFIVDGRGRIVVQQRSAKKYHSGGLWANSCCGHPRPGERTVSAARRRLDEELGLTSALSFGFFARYQAELGHGMHENEFVYVYFGRLRSEPKPDPDEVADIAPVLRRHQPAHPPRAGSFAACSSTISATRRRHVRLAQQASPCRGRDRKLSGIPSASPPAVVPAAGTPGQP